ncbi:MAG: sorting protein [Rhizobacter sp.]|nr:sorting protein [Rhizobacter sp.]
MRIPLIVAAAAALTFTASLSQATVINSAYTSLGGNSWLVDFTLVNDGTPASFAGFTIDLPNAMNLVLVASPSTWDSAVNQQDPGLPDEANLDSFAIDPSNIWGAGQSIGGFEVSFTYTAGATPGALPFMLYGEDFEPVFAGTTTVAAIPEPATVVLTALGLGLVGLYTRRKSTKNCNTSMEVAA